MGWFRRNLWGLVAIIPALVAIVALSWYGFYDALYLSKPARAVPADAQGWYPLLGGQVRLVSIDRPTDIKTYAGKPFPAPPDTTFWRVVLEVRAPEESYIGGCDVQLEDQNGRLFNPPDQPHHELSGAAGVNSHGCLPDDFDADESQYIGSSYFALPSDARAVAVRVTSRDTGPDYVRISLS